MSQSGFSTLEILMAMFILVLALTAVVTVSFGNQSMVADSQANAEALNLAQSLLEKSQADSRKDFNLVNPITAMTTADGFTSRLDVTQTDYFTKLVTASVDYPEDGGRKGNTKLSTLVTNFNNAIGGDTCSSILLPDTQAWKTPNIKNKIDPATGLPITDFSILAGVSGNYAISDVDAYQGKLYVTVGKTDNPGDPTFFIFNISNPLSPVLISKIDNALGTADGLSAVAIAEDQINHKIYAYVANRHGADFSTCSVSDECAQLQVIDVTDPVNPQIVDSHKLSNVFSATAGFGVGKSIFYKDGYIYLGLTDTGGTGPEFNILDAHSNHSQPVEIGGVNSYSVGDTVNSIKVRGKYAYLTTSGSQELITLDIQDPSCVVTDPQASASACKPSGPSAWGFNNANYDGRSIYLLGDDLYFGTAADDSNPSQFYILDNAGPENLQINNSVLPRPYVKEIDSSINGLIVRENLAFLLTKTNLKIFNAGDASNITDWGNLTLDAGASDVFEPVMDCEGNDFFVGSNISGHGYLSVIAP